jgi:hypothetical protein
MSNMDDFNEAAAKILAKLYETFPQLQSLDLIKVSGVPSPADNASTKGGAYAKLR